MSEDALVILLCCLTVFAMNVFPLPLPPSFLAMAAFYMAYDVPLVPLTVCASFSAACARAVFATGVGRFTDRIPEKQRRNAEAFAGYARKKVKLPAVFVAAYSFTGLTSNPLFVAVGLGALPFFTSVAAFFVARSIFNTIIVYLIAYVFDAFDAGDDITLMSLVIAIGGFIGAYIIFLNLPWTRWLGMEDEPSPEPDPAGGAV